MKLELLHDKAYMGFVFAGNNPEPNNHRWFLHFYAGERIFSAVHFDEAFIRTGGIKVGTSTWVENTPMGQNPHGRLVFDHDAYVMMKGGYRSQVFIGSAKDLESPVWEFDEKKPFGQLKWSRMKNNWSVHLWTPEDEKVLEAATVTLKKPRTFMTKVEESAQPKVYLVFNFETMSEIESVGASIIL